MARLLVLLLALASGALTIVGAFGPWATYIGQPARGIDANAGKSVSAAAALALLLVALSAWQRVRWPAILALGPAAIAGAIGGWYLAAPGGKFVHLVGASGTAEGYSSIRHGWGIYVTTYAAIALFVLCLVEVLVARRQAS